MRMRSKCKVDKAQRDVSLRNACYHLARESCCMYVAAATGYAAWLH
jgi:hypothetical protein